MFQELIRMKLTVKTADKKPTELQVEVSPTQTVEELGLQVGEALGRKVKKVVCVGKIADGHARLADVGLADGGVVIVMAEKAPKKQATPAASPAPASAPAPAASSGRPAASAAAATARREPAPAAGGASAAAIAQLVALGIADKERTAAQALEMAGGDIDRAAELLASGALVGVEATSASAVRAASAPTGALAELAAQPALQQMRAHVASDPQLLRPLLQQLGQSHPDLLDQIAENPAAFVRQLTAPVTATDMQRFAPHGGIPRVDPAASQQISLTAADESALKQLSEFGKFSREQLIEAYLACGKNLDQAATYLFDQQSS